MKRIVLFVVSCLAALSIGAAGAYFTGEAQVPENMIKAGSVAISTEPTSSAISCDALAPGVTVTKPVTVVNTGDLPVNFVVTAQKKSGITAFYDAITCHVVVDGNVVYDGLLSALKTAPVTLAAGARTQVQFGMSIPVEAGNDLAGGYAKLTLYVDAEQVH
jgi:hypothetical protein